VFHAEPSVLLDATAVPADRGGVGRYVDSLAAALDESGGNATEAARLLGAVGRGASRDPGGTVRAMKRRLGYRG